MYQHLEVLLKFGADPNISEGFSNFYHVAKKLNTNPDYGKYVIIIFFLLLYFNEIISFNCICTIKLNKTFFQFYQ